MVRSFHIQAILSGTYENGYLMDRNKKNESTIML